MKDIRYSCLLIALALAAFIATASAQTTTTTETTTTKTTKAKKEKPITAADVQALRDAIAAQQAALAAQQQEIRRLQQELHGKDQSVQQAESAAADAAAKAAAAQAEAAQQEQAVGELKNDVSDLKTNVNNAAASIQETQKTIHEEIESPLAIHYKGITITPGGFLAAETVRRSRALASDVNTPFNSLTMPGASQSDMSEFFGSGRQSRISMLAQGKLKSATLSGYYEADFLSAAVTSNNNESNSYSLRQRQAWGQTAFNDGWAITGGQMWSLVTETHHGVENRTEAVPLTIDPQYNVGFSWARQYGVRLSKDISNKFWLAASVENSQATFTTHGNEDNFLVGSAGASGGLYNAAISTCSSAINSTATTVTTTCTPIAGYSFNPAPDVIAKAVFEPGFGHYEIFGLAAAFRDRIFPCGGVSSTTICDGKTGPSALGAANSSREGGGFGANARWTIAKHVDFGLHFLGGKGVGRYGTAGLPDASIHADGAFNLVKNAQGLGTLEWHGSKLDVYFDGGVEYAGRAFDFDPITGKYVGYGSPFANNYGCYTETQPGVANGLAPGTLADCTGDSRAVLEGTGGFWYRFYNGPKGKVQWGAQYSYVTRETWYGVGFTKTGPTVSPSGLDNMVFSSLRYYLP
jgi:multidrug efflux pump subunit AcrA (membrane-fusion protein)